MSAKRFNCKVVGNILPTKTLHRWILCCRSYSLFSRVCAAEAYAQELEPDKQIDNPPKQHTTNVTRTSCGNEMVPSTPKVNMCITLYFGGILEIKKHKSKIGERNNLKIRLEGEVLTTDEFIELLEEKTPKTNVKAK